MKIITKRFINEMLNFMEKNNIKKLSFINCIIFCFHNENTLDKYILHYRNPITIAPPLEMRTISFFNEMRKIVTADNRKHFFRNLSIKEVYNKPIYENLEEMYKNTRYKTKNGKFKKEII